jgi:hypothetical protein
MFRLKWDETKNHQGEKGKKVAGICFKLILTNR